MKFAIHKTSQRYNETENAPHPSAKLEGDNWVIEINTLAKLLELAMAAGEEIIIDVDVGGLPEIEVYDDYRE